MRSCGRCKRPFIEVGPAIRTIYVLRFVFGLQMIEGNKAGFRRSLLSPLPSLLGNDEPIERIDQKRAEAAPRRVCQRQQIPFEDFFRNKILQ